MKKIFSFKVPLYLQIMLGMFVGILVGVIALQIDGASFINSWVRPWGGIFIRLLQQIGRAHV